MQEYKPHEIQKKCHEYWEKQTAHKFSKKEKSKVFSIDTPPPYPSGSPWHIGAAAHYSCIDMIARTARMQDYNVLFPIGFDRNGLPVERYTEKKYNIKMHDVSREKFMELCSNSLDPVEEEMQQIMQNLGMSCDFAKHYHTDSAEYRALTQTTFIELWNKGMIYEATRPTTFCIGCETAIADAEISYEQLQTELVYIKFKTQGSKEISIATTRPELICSCQAVVFNPNDKRYQNLKGKYAIIPVYERKVPILAHNIAKPEFGSGIVMICSYGDYSDVRLFRELKLKEIIAIDEKGKMKNLTGKYSGMTIKDARTAIIKDLTAQGLVEKKERILHNTPVCERCGMPIEIISLNEIYLKQLPYLKKMMEFTEKMRFLPEQHKQLLEDWIKSVTIDWPISRSRYYGTEIPLWYCNSCKKPHVPKPGKYYRPWLENAPFEKCSYCGCKEFTGETRTFDTWMDSSITPLFISGYKKNPKFFNLTYPCSIRPQGKDIVRTWLYYTLLRCYQLTGKCAFKYAWITGMGLDEKGEKMSKSKGNVLDPVEIIKKYGGDAFRFWAASEATLGSDFRCSEQRIESAGKFLVKLWNVAKFISTFSMPVVKKKQKLEALDEWIISEIDKTIRDCLQGYADLNFFIVANTVRNFIWNVFAPHYIELVKARAYSKSKEAISAHYTLYYCLQKILLLLAPITPFITDFIFHEIYKKTIHKERFPSVEKEKKLPFDTQELIELNSQIWKAKKERNLSLRTEIKKAILPKKFEVIAKDIKSAHNIFSLEFADTKKATFRFE